MEKSTWITLKPSIALIFVCWLLPIFWPYLPLRFVLPAERKDGTDSGEVAIFLMRFCSMFASYQRRLKGSWPNPLVSPWKASFWVMAPWPNVALRSTAQWVFDLSSLVEGTPPHMLSPTAPLLLLARFAVCPNDLPC